MSRIALIPARGGSKGIPGKNIRVFNGKPLIAWTIEVAKEVASIETVVVSTDCMEIANIARSHGASVPFMRPKELAEDLSPVSDLVNHALMKLPDVTDIVLLQPTSPLRRALDIEGALERRKALSVESVVSVVKAAKDPGLYFRLDSSERLEQLMEDGPKACRQSGDQFYVLNGAIYAFTREFFFRERRFVAETTAAYIMSEKRSIDIDSMLDWKLAEIISNEM